MLSVLRKHMANGDLCKEIQYKTGTEVLVWDDVRVIRWTQFSSMVDISSSEGVTHFDHYTQVPSDVHEYILNQYNVKRSA